MTTLNFLRQNCGRKMFLLYTFFSAEGNYACIYGVTFSRNLHQGSLVPAGIAFPVTLDKHSLSFDVWLIGPGWWQPVCGSMGHGNMETIFPGVGLSMKKTKIIFISSSSSLSSSNYRILILVQCLHWGIEICLILFSFKGFQTWYAKNHLQDWRDFCWSLTSKQLLRHWGWAKMASIWQTTVSNPFSWMKMHEFHLRFSSYNELVNRLWDWLME